MRILFVADDLYPGYGGQARSSEGHIAALARRGHRLSALAGRDPRPTAPPPGVELARLPAWRIPGTQTLLAFPSPSRVDAALARADVVHVNLPTPLAAVVLGRARRRGVPVVMGVHTQIETGALHLPMVGRALGAVLTAWYRALFARADLLVAPTPFAAELARAFAPGRIEAVSNGLDLTGFPKPRPKRPGERRRLAYVGRLSPEKRPLDLLDLLERLGPEVELTVAGSGPLAAELAQEVARRGLGQRVRLAGFVSEAEKRELLLASELFLMPSPAELQSIATLEAMACGCAVAAVGHASSAVPTLVRDGDAGLVLPPDDPAAQAAAVTALLEEPERLARLQANARAYAEQHSVERSAERLEELYREVIAAHAARA
ncbi:MAG: glycosyltransferase family 4 protein [Deinococcales bacterium]|nr:glycosyltransferase family 4 protein [Deinococcales bacterium]